MTNLFIAFMAFALGIGIGSMTANEKLAACIERVNG